MRQQEAARRWEEEINKPWGPSELSTYAQYRTEQKGTPFVVDKDNKDLVKLLCYYFTNDSRFEAMNKEDELSLKKGLLLCGNVGVGKSFLMEAFRANKRRCFQIIKCREVADSYAGHGAEVLRMYSDKIYVPTHPSTFYQRDIGLCFDDLGTEDSKKYYGDEVNVMADILLNRYDNNLEYHYTHITTNLTMDEIENKYGTRVRSRMRQMFNLIVLGGEDRRK